MSHPRLPVVKAFLICDQVIQDMQTGKKSLIGVFHEIKGHRFPTMHPELWIYANLTDASGEYTFEIRLLSLEDGAILGQGQPPPIEIPGPLQTTELSAQLRQVKLPSPGIYEFQLLANGELAASKTIRVTPAGETQPPDPGTLD